MLSFTVPVGNDTKEIVPTAQNDHFLIGSLSEFIKEADKYRDRKHMRETQFGAWGGGVSTNDAFRLAADGDLSAVEKSDKFLKEVEELFPAPTARHVMTDDVVGAFPNVPAFLAGTPMNMRRKHKVENEFSPLAVVVNLGSSAMVDANDVHKRGVAVLALVRALSSRRPVELWAGVTADGHEDREGEESTNVYFRIDTAPLDLAHAAHLLTHPSVSRMLAYSIILDRFKCKRSIPWQYRASGNPAALRKTYPQIIQRGFAHMSEVLAIPMLHGLDPMTKDPLGWLKEMVAKYGGADQ